MLRHILGLTSTILLFSLSACSGDDASPEQKPPPVKPDKPKPSDPPEVVTTSSGKLRGVVESDLLVFRGIPYAEPPVGERRFRAAEPVSPWKGTKDALAFGSSCAQPDQLDGTAKLVGSEDCLTLNVWTPDASPEKPLPVLFYIHGGYYVVGSSSDVLEGTTMYDGTYLARSGPAVVVTINYRLGPFGFLAHPGLSAESAHHGSGNWALTDQIEALRWVQKNIAAFGGDPKRVMLFGNSAGGGSAAALVASPRTAGLFASAILESSGGATASLAAAEAQGMELAKGAGCTEAATAAACLRSKKTAEIAGALDSGLGGYGPSVDGSVLPDTIYRLLEDGDYAHVPVIVGTTAAEFATLIYNFEPTPVASDADYQARVKTSFGDAFGAEVLGVYPSDAYASPQDALVAIYTDLVYGCPARRLTRALSGHDPGRVFRYVYTHAFAKGPLAPYGAAHPFDNWLVFHNLPSTLFDLQPEERALADDMARAWTSFAATADPNGGEVGPWKAYTLAGDNHLELDVAPKQAASFRAAQCDFWGPYL